MAHDIMDTMTSKYNSLTKSGKKVADYIFANRLEVQFMSITALADECNVAEATVFRLCRALGFAGYNDLKL
ncbi:MAG: MurR/RpiR family transcriptional regulator, partial [Oscillospiraceae bacterium]